MGIHEGSIYMYFMPHEVMSQVALLTDPSQASLDMTILSTAIPKITSDFHSLADVGWYAVSQNQVIPLLF